MNKSYIRDFSLWILVLVLFKCTYVSSMDAVASLTNQVIHDSGVIQDDAEYAPDLFPTLEEVSTNTHYEKDEPQVPGNLAYKGIELKTHYGSSRRFINRYEYKPNGRLYYFEENGYRTSRSNSRSNSPAPVRQDHSNSNQTSQSSKVPLIETDFTVLSSTSPVIPTIDITSSKSNYKKLYYMLGIAVIGCACAYTIKCIKNKKTITST